MGVKARSARARRRKLQWLPDGGGGAFPDCVDCYAWFRTTDLEDAVVQAVTDRPGWRPADAARQITARFHAAGHGAVPDTKEDP